jgi:hypothetical protein
MGKKTLIGIAAATGATLALLAAPAQARTSVYLNIDAGTPYVYQQPGYGYGYAQPTYVYTEPAYVYTQPTYVYTQPYGYAYGQRHRHLRDRDHDGVPNRYDRRPNNPYRY